MKPLKAATKPATPPTKKESTPQGLRILMIASEARPFSKTGGLADVLGALPPALARLGHRVTVVLPKYRGTQTDGVEGIAADVPFGPNRYPVRFVEQSRSQARAEMLRFMPEPVVESTLTILGTPKIGEQQVSPHVERILGRPPRTFAAWAERNTTAFK